MIALASDHGGFALKEEIQKHLKELGLEFTDYGTDSAESCDYPIFAEKAARAVAEGSAERGIVICSTGIGVSITANKVRGIRCALCTDCYSAELTRRHNDANMLALGALVTGRGLALKIVDIFLNTPFDGGRHARRLGQLMALDEKERP